MKNILMIIWDNLSFVVSIWLSVIKRFKNYRKNFKLKKIMGFKNEKVIVTFPIFSKKNINNSLHELVTVKCLENLKNVIDIGKRIGVEIDIPIDNDVSLLRNSDINDEIHIGGPLTNSYVHCFLNRFNDFIFYRRPEDKVININHNIKNDCIKVTNDNKGRFILLGDTKYFIDYEKDYLILIRFKELNERKIEKTMHIIFNTHYSNKVNILQPFIGYTDLLYNKVKGYENNYFLVIPIEKNTGILEIDKLEDKTNELDFFDLSIK